MEDVDGTRDRLVAGTFEGPASDPYRAVLVTTAETTRATLPVLSPPTLGAVSLAHLDAARRAAGEAVFEATASIFEGRGTDAVTDALVRLDAADLLLQQTAPPQLVAEVARSLASPDAVLAFSGTALIADGDLPDLLARPVGMGRRGGAVGPRLRRPGGRRDRTSVSVMTARAERAEQAARQFVVVAAAAWVGLLALSALVGHAVLAPRTTSGDRRAAVAAASATG